MTQRETNTVLVSAVGLLFSTVVALCTYIYFNDREVVNDTVQDSVVEVKEAASKVDVLSANVAANQIAMLEKIYGITLTSMNKINNLEVSNARTEGNYRELAQKLDSVIDTNTEFRQLVMSKFEANEKRFIRLEKNDSLQDKNINTLAKDRGVKIFTGVGW